ncbi:hypothetical protein BD769DRAFT_1370633 [Suillus cothurnatus]|nr:hypothetical protein BD769DRAFT_1370633 [Suillus cothurnatus]
MVGDLYCFTISDTSELINKGMDVPDILLVIQWRATCKLSMLWQRWGRATRDRQLQGTAILFAEKSTSMTCRRRGVSVRR